MTKLEHHAIFSEFVKLRKIWELPDYILDALWDLLVELGGDDMAPDEFKKVLAHSWYKFITESLATMPINKN